MTNFFSHFDINIVIIAFCALILGVQQWRYGSGKLTSDTIQTYKDLLEATERKNKEKQDDLQNQLNTQAGQIGELKGLITGKDQQIADYRQILENRNPNLENILTQMVNFMKEVDKRLQGIEDHIQKPLIAETKTTTSITKQ
jgi:capsule polysaccharide export protein KpsE/RkpR